MPRVLHVSQPVDGGVAAYVAQVAADQRARGWDVVVACPPTGALPGALAAHGVAHRPWHARRDPGPWVPREAGSLVGVVRDVDPDLVHLHSAKAGLAGRLALRAAVPTLVQPHGWSWLAAAGPALRGAARQWERHAARWSDACVCVGPGEAQLARDARIPGPRALVHNGVDLTRFRPADAAARAAARDALGLEQGVPLAVCVGRVCRQKGQDVLLRAWPAVRGALPDARLVLVGDPGPGAPVTVAGVHGAGHVDDVRPWLAAADVVVLPSRWEGLSLALLEALATARPVVVTEVAGLVDAVGEGTGAHVPPDDPRALADAVVTRLSDPARCRAEGVAAGRHAQRFDVRRTLDGLAALTLRALARSAEERRATHVDGRGPLPSPAAG
ncbi:glycosyltransferase [Actinomycetospora endophytica]|uniref:Glycosyltransferase n=1 Tax=Actinomycetospora endophytica TaxID=2291215 RepID=A0ABS8PCH4_9PSEU|nr:glycosyltransferase [Actinomycetospora endophytica]MCD2195933.1 glycosyltransferase [Actinomycetospora endophytica]